MRFRSFMADRQRIAIVFIVVTTISLISISQVRVQPITDAAVFLYMGQGHLRGEVLYFDQKDAKPPMVYYIGALIGALTFLSVFRYRSCREGGGG